MISHGDDSRHIQEDLDRPAMEEHVENVATINGRSSSFIRERNLTGRGNERAHGTSSVCRRLLTV